MPYPLRENDFAKVPVFVVGSLMAFIAGYVNSAMLLEFAMPVSQMTGIISRLSYAGLRSEWHYLLPAIMILFGFLIGAMFSGWIIGHRQYHQDRSYGYALLSVCGLLFVATLFSYIQSEVSVFLAAVACGLQNALVASYRGLQIRTTHMTGVITDIGAYCGLWLRTRDPWSWQPYLLISIVLAFVGGGMIGFYIHLTLPNISLIFPSITMGLLGILYLRRVAKNLKPSEPQNV